MADIKPGFYKARAVKGSEQFGVAETSSAQVGIDLTIYPPGRGERDAFSMTTVLSFGGEAQKYSVDRLFALGWDGKDILKLDGIDRNEVDVEVFFDNFEGRARPRVEIRTQAMGTFKFKERNVMTDEERARFAQDTQSFMKSRK